MKRMLIALCVATLALVGCGDAKPSKGAVAKALKSQVQQKSGATDAKSKKKISNYVDCIVDKSYDDISTDSLKKIVKSSDIDSLQEIQDGKEKDSFDKAAEKCQPKLAQ